MSPAAEDRPRLRVPHSEPSRVAESHKERQTLLTSRLLVLQHFVVIVFTNEAALQMLLSMRFQPSVEVQGSGTFMVTVPNGVHVLARDYGTLLAFKQGGTSQVIGTARKGQRVRVRQSFSVLLAHYAYDQIPIMLRFAHLENHPTGVVQIVEKWIFDWMHTKFK